MKPCNEFTSPENRFFYPVNHTVEHHESFDTTALPGAENIPGREHHVVLNDAASNVYAQELGRYGDYIPAGATILGIKGYQPRVGLRSNNDPHVEQADFDRFDDACSYELTEPQKSLVIVQANTSRFDEGITDPRFDERGIAILPADEPLPTLVGSGAPDTRTNYRLHGLITPGDKLVTWGSDESTTLDWCVAAQVKQNRLEEALLEEALPVGGDLPGMLHARPAAYTYLKYFDSKHNTSYVPTEDPRNYFGESEFPQLTTDQYDLYMRLADLAHRFMRQRR